jgi:general secretion pathway protein G
MSQRDQAFTLIEVMAVILILGLIATIVAVNVFDRIEWARVQTTKVKMRNVESSLDMFRFDQRSYPTTEQGLVALLERPSVGDVRYYPESGYVRDQEVIEDGWQRPFGYESPALRSRVGFDLWSNGRDGAEGGDGVDEDITNWDQSG